MNTLILKHQNPILNDSNSLNRAADRIPEIRISIKDCDFYLFERLRIHKILKFKRSLINDCEIFQTHRIRNFL